MPTAESSPDHTLSDKPELSACDQEQIHLLGQVQSHGALILLGGSSGLDIVGASDNCADWIGVEDSALRELSLTDLLEEQDRLWLRTLSRMDAPFKRPSRSVTLTNGKEAVLGYVRSAGFAVLELEPVTPEKEWRGRLDPTGFERITKKIEESKNLYRAGQSVADALRKIADFSHVMVYRFHADWSGEVIAESRVPDQVPYLGLRYPASDIPAQARDLYRKNLVRALHDRDQEGVPVRFFQDGKAPDLGMSILRTVSPYHLEYLRNMGVRSSMVLSILVEGKLWGLVTCHDPEPQQAPAVLRQFSLDVVRRLGDFIQRKQQEEKEDRKRAVQEISAQLKARFSQVNPDFGGNLMDLCFFGHQRLETLANADGAGIFLEGDTWIGSGLMPHLRWVKKFFRHLRNHPEQSMFVSEQAPDGLELPECDTRKTCGFMAYVVSREPYVISFVFRSEFVHEISWGGNPEKAALPDKDGRISPRKSFEAWRETVKGRSTEWSEWDQDMLTAFGQAFSTIGSPFEHKNHLLSVLRSAASTLIYRLRNYFDLSSSFMDTINEGLALSSVAVNGKTNQTFFVNRGLVNYVGFQSYRRESMTLDQLFSRLGLDAETTMSDESHGKVHDVVSPRLGYRKMIIKKHTLLTLFQESDQFEVVMLNFIDVTLNKRLLQSMRVARDQAILGGEVQLNLLENLRRDFSQQVTALEEEAKAEAKGNGASRLSKRVVEHTQKMQRQIEEMLNYAEVQAVVSLLDETEFSFSSIYDESRENLQAQALEKNISLNLREQNGKVELWGDAKALHDIVLKILSNGVRYSPPNGSVESRSYLSKQGEFVFEVADSGPIFAKEKLDRLFQPMFVHSENLPYASQEDDEFYGLSLMLAKSMIELHGGKLEIDQDDAMGKAVRMILPPFRVVSKR